MVRSPKSLPVPGDGNLHCSTVCTCTLSWPGPCDPSAAAKAEEASGRVFTLKVKTCCFARPSHMFAAEVIPPLLQVVVCPITLLRILSGILSSTFSKTGLRENLFAHVNTNRSNMLRTGEIPARVRLVRKARGSPKLQQFRLGWLRRNTRQSHSALQRRAIQRREPLLHC